jgi:hypothetical protein
LDIRVLKKRKQNFKYLSKRMHLYRDIDTKKVCQISNFGIFFEVSTVTQGKWFGFGSIAFFLILYDVVVHGVDNEEPELHHIGGGRQGCQRRVRVRRASHYSTRDNKSCTRTNKQKLSIDNILLYLFKSTEPQPQQ